MHGSRLGNQSGLRGRVFIGTLMAAAWWGIPADAGVVPGDLTVEPVAGGFTRPLAVRHSGDGTGRLFIVEQRGIIKIYDQVSDTVHPTPFLDIDPLVDSSGNEQGLLGLAFHPDFAANGQFFVNYTRQASPLDRTVIARYTVSAANPDVADPASAVTLLELEQDFSNHNGGNLLFGPDGYLYIGTGDGGSGEDPFNRAQPLTTLLGKMLRIDVDGEMGEMDHPCGLNPSSYGIPPDNPFTGTGTCDEIWAYGLRNPWRFSFDRFNGDLFIGDVGQYNIEEVDHQPVSSAGGENYGWSCMEGNATVNYNLCDGAPLTAPIFTYTHALGNSITGGYRYRGPIRSLRGTYVMGDYGSGRIWFGDPVGASWNFSVWMDTATSIPSFGEDEIGNLYYSSFNGTLYKFTLPASTGAGRTPDGQGAEPPLTLALAGSQLELSWGASCNTLDSDYEVYEGALGDFESHKARLCSTGGAQSAAINPNSGNRYYLVVPRNASREGSYGTNSYGLERPAGVSTCSDQALSGCP